MSDVCQELQNIKYQTMLLNHNSKIYESTPNTENIEIFLRNEKESNKSKPWSKLSKSTKLKKISQYLIAYSEEKKLNEAQTKELKIYLIKCLERKKLQRQKDVIYDIETNIIKSITSLIFNKTTNKFTLKRSDKRTSTLKSMAPKKIKKKRIKKNKIDTNLNK
tara:strand:- start:228 stop:716 length:489 start_codon:yes stop_codon:yes gene_type:complete